MSAETNVLRPTVWQQNADMAATRDRDAAAALVVACARRDALDLILDGKPGQALYKLARAIDSAARILGGAA